MANKLSAKRLKLINDINDLREIAEPLARLQYEAAGYRGMASPNSELPISIGLNGVTFYEVEQVYSYGDEYLETYDNIVSWEDIDNPKAAEDRLEAEIKKSKRAQEELYKESRRSQYEALKKEFGG